MDEIHLDHIDWMYCWNHSRTQYSDLDFGLNPVFEQMFREIEEIIVPDTEVFWSTYIKQLSPSTYGMWCYTKT